MKQVANESSKGTCLPIELRPIKTGGIGVGVFRKYCKWTWAGHISSFVYRFPEETSLEISLHFLHENSHSLGRNQKPQTWMLDGQ